MDITHKLCAYIIIAHCDARRAGKFAVDLYFRDVISLCIVNNKLPLEYY